MTLGSEPPAPRRGEAVTLTVRLTNQSPFSVGSMLVEVVPPNGAQVEEAVPLTGTVERDGPVLHWLIPALATEATTRLTLRAVLLQADTALELCATLLSSGSAVEHCLALEPAAATGAESPLQDDAPAFGLAAAPRTEAGGDMLRLALFVLGLVLLGLWAGTAVRSRRLLAERRAGDLLIDPVQGVGVGGEVEAPRVTGDELE